MGIPAQRRASANQACVRASQESSATTEMSVLKTCVMEESCHVDTTLPCDDGNLCTEEDTCDEGNCIGSEVDCEDDNFCTLVSCYAFTGCVYTPNNGVQCDDDNECTSFDTCQGSTCLGITAECDDEDPCTDDFCNPDTGLCDSEFNSAACDDGLDCTVSDYCADGSCVGGEVTCDDGLQCTLNLCVDSECLHPIGAWPTML